MVKRLGEESRSDAEAIVTCLASSRVVVLSERGAMTLVYSDALDGFAVHRAAAAVVGIDDGDGERTDGVFNLFRIPKRRDEFRLKRKEKE